ncbi:MAG: FAD-dependent oxidoreductase [Acutalibacteraceae bacterium]|nr:FAD-dependent oxidoreductase [Acutalibacteraceae bacterium]
MFNYDIIVCGGGPSGVSAAISAGRKGMKVLLVEKQNCLGGMWTSGYVCPLFDVVQDTPIINELVEELKSTDNWGGFIGASFNYEFMKYFLEKKCIEVDVDILYDTTFLDIVKISDGWKFKVNNINGVVEYNCKICIDASGDAVVADKAGAQWRIGETDYKQCQAMTLMFLIGNLPADYTKMKNCYSELETAYKNAGMDVGKIPFKVPYIIQIPNTNFGVVQLTHMHGYDPLDASSRTMAVIEGRRQIIETFSTLKNYNPDFKDIELITSASLLGVRESRRIVGEYEITVQDALNGSRFEDKTASCYFNMDVHDAVSGEQHCTHIKRFDVPFRSFIPKGLDNFLVVGRCISGDHRVMAAYRVTGDCSAMGDCAGNAAANAIIKNKSLRDVTPDELYN